MPLFDFWVMSNEYSQTPVSQSSLCEFVGLVTTFNLEIGITGAILTKLDGDSRGGAALSVKEVCVSVLRFHPIILFGINFFCKI